MLAELDLPQPMAWPARGRKGLLANHVGQDRAGLLAGVGHDVDALEEVAVGREGVDLALGGRTGDRQRGQDLRRPILEADDLGPVSYTHLRAHETVLDLVCRL